MLPFDAHIEVNFSRPPTEGDLRLTTVLVDQLLQYDPSLWLERDVAVIRTHGDRNLTITAWHTELRQLANVLDRVFCLRIPSQEEVQKNQGLTDFIESLREDPFLEMKRDIQGVTLWNRLP